MPTYIKSPIIAIAASLLLSLLLTLLVRTLARRRNIVAAPKTDRWHKKPTAMLGGIAIFLATALTYLAFVPHRPQSLVIMVASAMLFGVGLVDDFLNVKPYIKLIGQVVGATFVIYFGLHLPWTTFEPLNIAITIFWLVGITNAVNLLDNMDGLAAGVAAIAASFLATSFFLGGQSSEALMLSVFAAALVGFLVFNSNPASIFMGDCGSMFIGFFLAGSVLLTEGGGRSRNLVSVLSVPALILFMPIFDTTFVTLMRKLKGRTVSQGGRDHTSHRLVALGMTERHAVWMLYLFAALSGGLALMMQGLSLDLSLALIAGLIIVLTLLGIYLAGVKVYEEDEIKSTVDKPLFAFLVDLSYKRRLFEVLLDVVLIILAYYSANLMLFGTMEQGNLWQLFVRAMPVLICVNLAAFLAMGVYRGLWRYTSVDDLVVFVKAVGLGSVTSVLVLLLLFRFQGFSRAAFVLHTLLLLAMLAASRMTFRLFRQVLPTSKGRGGRRVLIYGAGDGGELLLREIFNNRELECVPVGFIDDDPLKKGKVIHGLRVLGGNEQLAEICRAQNVREVLISSSKFSAARLQDIMRGCEQENIQFKRMHISFEPLHAGELDLLSSAEPETIELKTRAHGVGVE
jgi:UDP-GlcNAc:undecaprenyl-phosphate GlcNAc-1-phosphate transferase